MVAGGVARVSVREERALRGREREGQKRREEEERVFDI
jgi:hypothetical protein